jgi:hypothetical protein
MYYCVACKAHKDKLENKDVLVLLKCAEQHRTLLSRFGVVSYSEDFTWLDEELAQVSASGVRAHLLLTRTPSTQQRYSTQVQSLQQEWMSRLHKSDIQSQPQRINGHIVGSWPEDLTRQMQLQLSIALKEVPGELGSRIAIELLQLLSSFGGVQAQWLRQHSLSLQVEILCAYSNNHARFAEQLEEAVRELCDEIDR